MQIGHIVASLLVGPIVFGIGSALLMVGAQAVVLGASRREDRGRSIAIVRIALSMGMPAGLVLGGLIADFASDSAAFLTGAGLTLAGAVVALALIPAGRTAPAPSGGTNGETDLTWLKPDVKKEIRKNVLSMSRLHAQQ